MGEARYRPASGTHFAAMEDGTGVVLDLESKSYLHLNASGTLLWQTLKDGGTLEELAHVLADRYALDMEPALRDAQHWVDELVSRKVIVCDD
ncbi:MAG: PqqD family protein [Myxococcota bacterium]